MADPQLAIIDRIRDLMIADSAFDDLGIIYSGVPNSVPAQYPEFAIVAITGEGEARSLSGGDTVTAYEGLIAFNVRGQDVPNPTGRKADVSSYAKVVEYVAAVKRLFKWNDPDISTLNGLQDSGGAWAVWGFYVSDGGDVAYGYSALDERENNYENYAIVPFVCAVNE